ncbi:MAG: hypothetical protein IT320_06055 [Anaerolineae bacterium]|nr:hypothetical protein [Anaerolineae bacterium]
MDIPIFPLSEAPKPREEVRIEALDVALYRDRMRVLVHVRVTPFMERPNLLIVVRDESDRLVGELNVIETMHNDMEFTLHLRGVNDPTGWYTAEADLFYETRNPPLDSRVEAFEIPAFAPDEDEL